MQPFLILNLEIVAEIKLWWDSNPGRKDCHHIISKFECLVCEAPVVASGKVHGGGHLNGESKVFVGGAEVGLWPTNCQFAT